MMLDENIKNDIEKAKQRHYVINNSFYNTEDRYHNAQLLNHFNSFGSKPAIEAYDDNITFHYDLYAIYFSIALHPEKIFEVTDYTASYFDVYGNPNDFELRYDLVDIISKELAKFAYWGGEAEDD